MTDTVSPILVKKIPDLRVNEGSTFTLDLRDYIQNLSNRSGDITFTISLFDGGPLPAGVEYTREGVVSGIPEPGTVQASPYSLLIIAKNKADVPLITETNLWIVDPNAVQEETVKQPEEQLSAVEVPYELNDDFWSLFGSEEKETNHFIDAAAGNWSEKLNDKAYRQFFVEYLLRKFSSLQIYNAEYEHADGIEKTVYERASTGWPIVIDGHFAMATSNPDPFASYLNRGAFVQTVREMVNKAAEKGWKTVGVAGYDKRLGWRMVREYNAQEKSKPLAAQRVLGYDDVFQDKDWVDQLFNDKLPTKQLNTGDTI